MTWFSDSEYVAAARQALRSSTRGTAALDSLGWWDLVDCLDDREAAEAVFALSEAEGREASFTPAFGALLSRPYAGRLPVRTTMAVSVDSAVVRKPIVVGEPLDAVVAERPDGGLAVYLAEHCVFEPIDGNVRSPMFWLNVTGAPHELLGGPADISGRADGVALGRLAAAYTMLGAATSALELAVDHAGQREQFGQPISSFQVPRHLLASAAMDLASLRAVCDAARCSLPGLPASLDAIAKALAGRNARRVCERTLQVLGALGFTAEHTHHRLHSAVLAFDALLGSSATLMAALGARARAGEAVWHVSEHFLQDAAASSGN